MFGKIKERTRWLFHETVLPQISVFLLLSLYSIGNKSFWVDEVYTMDYVNDGFGRFFGDPNMILYYVLLKAWIVFGENETFVRALSAFAIACSFPALFKIGKTLFTQQTGSIAVWLMAVNPVTIQYAQNARSYGLLLSLSIWSTYVFIRSLRNSDYKWRLAYIALITATAYTHYFGILIAGLHLTAYTLIARKKIRLIIIYGFCVLILIFPLFHMAIQLPKKLEFRTKPAAGTVFKTVRTFSGGSNITLSLYGIMVIAGIYGVFIYRRRKDKASVFPYISHYLFAFAWLMGPVLFAFVFSIFIKPIYAHHYLLICQPALLLMAASGLSALSIKPLQTGIVILCMLFASLPALIQLYKTDPEPWRSVVEYIGQSYQPGDAVIVYAYFARYSFEYYLTRSDSSKDNIPVVEIADGAYSRGGGSFEPELNFQLLSNLDKSYSRVWLILSHHSNVILGRERRALQIQDAMRTKFVPVEKNLFGKIEVFSYRSSKIKP